MPDVSGNDVLTLPESDTSSLEYDVLYNAVYDATVAANMVEETVTDGQSINSTALSYFQGILANKAIPEDYVIYVGDKYTYISGYGEREAYEYCMAYGNLDLDGTVFSGDVTICRLRTSGDVSVSYEYGQSISLDAPLYYSRSNLGDYSGVIDYDWSGFLISNALVLGGLVWFVRKLLRISY